MHLFLVDSSIFVFRAWYGPETDRVNRACEPNQAFVGFSDFVYRLLTEQAPSHLVFAFDESLARSERRRIYPEYKANRSPAPPELKRQFGWCRQWLEALGISCVSSKLWEADDLIGSLARYHRRPQLPVAILTADKDLAQLIESGDLWWSYLEGQQMDERAIVRKFGVRPEQIADWLALCGDKADNIPGIPEVGAKTASLLLKKFGSIDELRRNLPRVGEMKFRYAARVQRSLIEHRELLELTPALTRVNCGIEAMRRVPITRRGSDPRRLERMMHEQAFESARLERWRRYLDIRRAGAA